MKNVKIVPDHPLKNRGCRIMKRMEASRGSCVRKTLAAIPLLAVALCVSGANAIAPRPAMDELNNQLASASPGAFAPPIKQTERAIRPGGSGSALQSGSSDDTSTETTTLEYETPTHFIIIVIVVVYDERGNVLDVRTHTFTVPKAGREIAPAPAAAPPPPPPELKSGLEREPPVNPF